MSAQPNKYSPALTYIPATVRAWASTGNTDTVTDDAVQSGSFIDLMPTSSFAGRWYVSSVAQGSFTVTSTSSETATTTTYKYRVG